MRSLSDRAHEEILFLKDNALDVNLLVEWPLAGLVMLHAPNAKVFIDGRAQQVYDETLYRKYHLLLVAEDTPPELMLRILDEHDTDAVLLRRWKPVRNLRLTLDQSGDWVPALLDADCELFLRKGSRGLVQLGWLLRRGQEWRPDSPLARASRGFVWEATTPPDLEQAVACWQSAVRRDVTVGSRCFRRLTRALLQLGREQEARQLVDSYHQALSQPFTRLPGDLRGELLQTLAACRRDIDAANSPGQPDHADD